MTLNFNPISRTFGAEVVGFDMSQVDDPAVRAELNEAFGKHRLILFRDLHIDAAEQARLVEVFGKHAPRPPIFEQVNSPEPNTQYVSNTRTDGMLPDGELTYHQDHLFDEAPVKAIMLYGVEAPSAGGQTKFRSLDETYRRLSPETRALAEKVRCLHIWDWVKGPLPGPNTERRQYYTLDTVTPGQPQTWHPMVYRSPNGGDPSVWALYGTTGAFEGVSTEEGFKLIEDILDVAEQTEEYRHQWRVGDALIWDNRHLQHAREPFLPTEKRTLRRSVLA